ncbi:MAG TPA: hypothetical protein P5513_04030 [Candidatus Diapherotrites archaeon]|nr:hypothetical protein [Candidatus Diapherotrites archaeon]
MILDIDQISKLECKYPKGSLPFIALSNMINFVLSNEGNRERLINSISFLTLYELGVIKNKEENKKVYQINS